MFIMKKEQQFLEILDHTIYWLVLRKPHWLLLLHAPSLPFWN